MLNILKTDFYKAFRTSSFWVISVLSICSSLLLSISVFWLYTDPEFLEAAQQSQILNFFNTFPSILFGCTFLMLIFAIMFSVSDFSYGTIKNIASKGYRREYIFFSKFITVLFFALFNILLSFLTSFITAQIMINNKIPNFFSYNNEFLPALLKYTLQLTAYISLAILIVMLIRSLGASLAIFISFVFLEGSAIQLIDKLINFIFKSDFSVYPYFITGAFADSSKTTQGVIVLLLYIVVSTIIGIYSFKKRDIN